MDLIDAIDAGVARLARARKWAKNVLELFRFWNVWWFVRNLDRLEHVSMRNQVVQIPPRHRDVWRRYCSTGRREITITIAPTPDAVEYLNARGIQHGPEDGYDGF